MQKPVLAILDKGKQNELKIGLSNMLFDQQNCDEFKFWFFFNEVQHNPFNGIEMEKITVDVYCVDSNNNVNYGQGQHVNQSVIPE